MRILVTGGAGFIGGHLAEAFLRDGHDVTVLDNLEPFYDVRLKEHTLDVHREVASDNEGSYTFREGDMRDAETVRRSSPTRTSWSIRRPRRASGRASRSRGG